MNNGDDTQDSNGQDSKGPGKRGKTSGSGRSSRRRKAVRPAVIEGEAREIPSGETAPSENVETPEAAESPQTAETPETEAPETDAAGADTQGEATRYSESGAETEPVAADESPSAGESEAQTAETAGTTKDATAAEDGNTAGTETPADDATTADTETGAPAPEPETAEAAKPVDEPHLPTARRASVLAAGIVGAVLAVSAYWVADYYGYLPRIGATNDELADSIQDLERRVGDMQSTVTSFTRHDLPKAIAERLSGLEKSVKDLGGKPNNTLADRVGTVEDKINDLSKSVAAGGATAGTAVSADLDKRLSDIESRVSAVESRPAVVSSDGAPVDDATAKALTDRIDALDTQMKQLATTLDQIKTSATGTATDSGQLKQIETTLASLKAQLDTVSGDVSGVTKDVNAKVAALQKTVDEKVTAPADTVARATAGTLALTALQRAVDSGQPYASELAILAKLTDDKTDIATLRTDADKGITDLVSLQARFDETANAIMAAGDDQATGIVGSLMDSARSLVRVRPAGKVEGDSRGAIVSRIEAALESGDLKTAESEWETLDAPAKAASKDWADDLKARIAANSALESLSSTLTAALAGPAGNATEGGAKATDTPAKGTKSDAAAQN